MSAILEMFSIGIGVLLQPATFIALFLGTLLGVTVGAIPGINDTITMAVIIPITFGMNPYIALAILVGVYSGSASGGAIPAILLRIPGTVSSMLTSEDGYPMTEKGESGKALGIALTSSAIGGLSSSLILLFLAPFLAQQALRFGPPEYFMLTILGLSTVVTVAGRSKNVGKNLLAMGLGFLVSSVGMSPQTGYARFTFGIRHLVEGIPTIPIMIGMFGMNSVFSFVESIGGSSVIIKNYKNIRAEIPNKELAKRLLPTWIRSSIIGNIIGVIPGAGMSMAIFLAYNQAVRSNAELEFGTGIPEGVAAPECANNSVVGSSMVPLVSLGIPGNSTSALFLGGLMIHGLRAGPSLFRDAPDIAYCIVLGFLLANIMLLPISIAFCNLLALPVLRVKQEPLSAVVLILCVTGAFACGNNAFNVLVMTFFGLVAYMFRRFKIPSAPFILSRVLGGMLETSWLQTKVYGKNPLFVLLTRPVSLALIVVTLLSVFMPIIIDKTKMQRKQRRVINT